ncbi:Uncharacterized protein KIAA1143 homolog-like Protein [Tribolium castaneum]|uniref:Uncharacterized protein KIAA1143 homolog-like Protein n=1 Tax=Tribolium castaneum TaxID=7070 RepID=D6WIW8_TRICA|nr:Uncharacterized protein KIAA1143 homolog-like Protein [Tribolium castaneum]
MEAENKPSREGRNRLAPLATNKNRADDAMSKRNITFTKPEEPEFLKRLKQAAGYQEGPTVDTKRQDLGPAEDLEEAADERPTVVVLQEGDLTAEEAAKLEKESEEAPADLNTRIVFKAPKKKNENQPSKTTNVKKVKSKTLLSFDEEEDDD